MTSRNTDKTSGSLHVIWMDVLEVRSSTVDPALPASSGATKPVSAEERATRLATLGQTCAARVLATSAVERSRCVSTIRTRSRRRHRASCIETARADPHTASSCSSQTGDGRFLSLRRSRRSALRGKDSPARAYHRPSNTMLPRSWRSWPQPGDRRPRVGSGGTLVVPRGKQVRTRRAGKRSRLQRAPIATRRRRSVSGAK